MGFIEPTVMVIDDNNEGKSYLLKIYPLKNVVVSSASIATMLWKIISWSFPSISFIAYYYLFIQCLLFSPFWRDLTTNEWSCPQTSNHIKFFKNFRRNKVILNRFNLILRRYAWKKKLLFPRLIASHNPSAKLFEHTRDFLLWKQVESHQFAADPMHCFVSLKTDS